MTIEEKAKRYDETIEKLRDFYRDYDNISLLIDIKEELANLIPELKDNEDEDERIRKMLISQMERWHKVALENNVVQDVKDSADAISWLEEQGKLKNYDEAEKEKTDFVNDGFIKCYADFLDFKKGNTYWLEYIGDDKYNVRSDNLLGKTYHITPCQLYTVFKKLSWLEKEGELKPADKIEPKFHEGDFIKHNNASLIYKVISVNSDSYYIENIETSGRNELFNVEQSFHLWTIQDAKDGDVLADGNLPFIFKKIDTNRYSSAYCGISVDDGFKIKSDGESSEWTWMQDIKPATKEQHDLLFAKMKEAGYEWDAEKKKLKELTQQEVTKPSGQETSEWGEEDEKMLNSFLHKAEVCDLLTNKEYRWIVNNLKSLRPLNTWKPSDLPHWKKSTLPNDNSTGFNSDYFHYKGYNINYIDLFEKLPKDD